MIQQVGLAVLQLGIGLAILFAGGEALVRGATAVALLARISTTVVALTVVAMGTSLPELAVSVDAAARGSTDIAYSNIVGSSIFNIGAILALAAVLTVIQVQRQTIRVEYPIMFAAAVIVLLLARDGMVDRLEGVGLLVGLVLFIAYTVYLVSRGVPLTEAAALERDVKRAGHLKNGALRAWGINVALVAVGLAALVGGADLSVMGSVTIARTLGIEERVIGLTVIAMGTSLPELATCVMATRRREPDIVLGNVIGSNVFNLFAILGVTAAVFPVPVHPVARAVDNWVLVAFSAVLFPMMWWGHKISRRDGIVLLVGFTVYIAWVVVAR
ncbi:MAG: calcium/sodium antiporter [Gemmatimonadota bacterium]|nr:MAG: calcium/sodium antiporter [Gemmatimonadota bacterium]